MNIFKRIFTTKKDTSKISEQANQPQVSHKDEFKTSNAKISLVSKKIESYGTTKNNE